MQHFLLKNFQRVHSACGSLRKWIDNNLLTIHSQNKIEEKKNLRNRVEFFVSTYCMSIGIILQHLSFWECVFVMCLKNKSVFLNVPKISKNNFYICVCVFLCDSASVKTFHTTFVQQNYFLFDLVAKLVTTTHILPWIHPARHFSQWNTNFWH